MWENVDLNLTHSSSYVTQYTEHTLVCICSQGNIFSIFFPTFIPGPEYISINYVTSKTSASLRSPHISRNFVRKKIYKTSLLLRLKFTAHNLCRTYTRSFYTSTYFSSKKKKKKRKRKTSASKNKVE